MAASPAGASLRVALHRVEESPWTRNWKHLRPIPKRHWLQKGTRLDSIHPVPPRDRIRQWNIVPGDRVRIRGDFGGPIKEVLGINKLRNLVFLKAPTTTAEEEKPPSVSYARCQLYIGDREFPPAPGENEPRVLPVFASRIGCTAPSFVASLGRFDWERFAVQTIPRLGNRDEKIKILIPWPKPEPPSLPPIEAYDTPENVVKEITWRPSPICYPPATRTKSKLLQDAYLHSIRPSPSSVPVPEYDPTTSPPFEYVLHSELSNPHSSAQKRFRARNRLRQLELAHKRFIDDELKSLDGRTRKEALAEAEWKWKELLRERDRERMKRQWVLRGDAARLNRKRRRKARKARREMDKLKHLTLEPALNQVLPSTPPV